MRKSLLFIFLLVGLLVNKSNAQTENPNQINHYSAESVIPQTPDVAGMTRYGQYPVNLSSGLVNINIPLYTIKSRQLELPITLSYHLSGIRINDISSNIGLGWTLNAGGMISLQIKGARGSESGTYNAPTELELENEKEDYSLQAKFKSLCYYDKTQSDFYSYSISNGINGHFVYNNSGELVQIQQTDNKIKFDTKTGAYTITLEEGVKYIFEKKDIVTSSLSGSYGTTAFNLSKMVSADSKDSIVFTYAKIPDYYRYSTNFTAFESRNYTDAIAGTISYKQEKTYAMTGYKDLVLQKITFSGGEVLFDLVEDRLDQGKIRINSIEVNQTRLKEQDTPKSVFRCIFFHDYFVSQGAETAEYPEFFHRLKLTGINMEGLGQKDLQSYYCPKYCFAFFPISFTAKFTPVGYPYPEKFDYTSYFKIS